LGPDPFDTASLRDRAIATWTSSPVRLREDANSEDDAALSAYQDRLVAELAQNAADAASRVGVPGRLHLRLADGVLYAANPGTPLDPAGVEALSHRRISTKVEGEVGRYGVGFAAVLSVSDSPSIHTATTGVQWSRARTAETLVALPELAAELTRRDGAVPVMRLPWPAEPADAIVAELLADANDTVVRLPLRDAGAVERVRELLDGADPLLPLFLDGLDELIVDGDVDARRLVVRRRGVEVELDADGVMSTWLVHRETGHVDGLLLASRPVEERERPTWTVTWAMQVEDGRAVPHHTDHRLRAPQPVDDVIDVPAVLSATMPLDIGRRHVVAGPVTDVVIGHAARAYVALLEALPPGPWLVDLLPGTLPAGPVDLALRDALAPLLPRARLLGSAADPYLRLRPEEAQVLDVGAAADPLTALLAQHAPQLVAPAYVAGGRRQAALVALGARLLDTADVVDLLGAVDAPPGWWADVIAALALAPDRDALRALPLPLADGSVAVGARGLLLPGDDDVAEALAAAGLGVRRIHPEVVTSPAALELLRGLGARDPDPAGFLDDPRLRALVESALDDADADLEALSDAVLSLLARQPELGAPRPWLAELPLPDSSGEWRPAGELLLPAEVGGAARAGRLVEVMDPAGAFGVVADSTVAAHGADAVVAAGVLRTFAVAAEDDVVIGDGEMEVYLDRSDEWLAELADRLPDDGAPWVLVHVEGVRDLELVAPTAPAWATALDELGREQFRVVAEPVTAVRDAARAQLPSYTSWWLRRQPCVPDADGALHRPDHVAAADADPMLRALFPVAAELSEPARRVLAEVGLIADVADLDADQVAETLVRLADHGPRVDVTDVRDMYAALLHRASSVGGGAPSRVCALTSVGLETVPAIDAVVVDAPDLIPLLGPVARVPARLADATSLADLLDVELASEVVAGDVTSTPLREATVDAGALPPGWPASSTAYAVHDPLECADAGGAAVRVGWRVLGDALHVDAADVLGNLARALAWHAGRWSERHLLHAMLLTDPAGRARLHAEAELG
ncbi:MAG TPA: hypothetical protein VNA14_12815, partial [Mycobacteriales bacterium]|nr:hypothetical protein [Mycobacteriales bacterium]